MISIRHAITRIACIYQRFFINKLHYVDWLPLLAIRLYLTPIMLQAGWVKYQSFDSIVMWFGEHGMNLPLPWFMALSVTALELLGGILLLLGFATRVISIALFIVMLVAAKLVHWHNGWLAIADPNSWFADGTIFLNQSVLESEQKLIRAKEILAQHGHIDWLTSSGNFVVLNNGVEFAATYIVMLGVLVAYGAGKWLSVDYWVRKATQPA